MGCHGLPEEGGGDKGLRGGRGQEPGACHLVKLWEDPGWAGFLVSMLFEGLIEHFSPQFLPLLGEVSNENLFSSIESSYIKISILAFSKFRV